MSGQKQIYQLVHETQIYLRKTADLLSDPEMRTLARCFADDLEAETSRPPTLSRMRSVDVRGLRYGPMLFDPDSSLCQAIFHAALNAFPYARWSEFYKETPWTESFLSRFATGECIGPTGRFLSDDLILGLFILGPDTYYPAHAHPAEEFYIVIAGEAEFQTGVASSFVAKQQGDVVLHQSNVSHAIRSAAQPMFAIYGWRGEIMAPSWYRDNMADESEPKKFPNLPSANPASQNPRSFGEA